MEDEEKIYGLIAQAEDIQKYTLQLQREAQEAVAGLPAVVNQSAKIIRKNSIQIALFCVTIIVVFGILGGVYLEFMTRHLQTEVQELRQEIGQLESTAKKLRQAGGDAIISTCGDEGRLCVQVDESAGRYTDKNKNVYMMLKK